MMYMTKVWRFMDPHGPLQFSEPGWRDGSRDKFKPGDLVAMVGTKEAPTPPEKRGRLLGLVEPTREICAVRDFGLNNPNIAIAEDFNPDGTHKRPYGLLIRRAWRFSQPPLLSEISSRRFSMDAVRGVVPLTADEISRIEKLAKEEEALAHSLREVMRLEGEEAARRRGAPPPSTQRRGIMHIRRAMAYTYLMRITNGANGTAFKIGWALDYRKRVRDFNSTALPQLGGLRYKVELTEQWNTAREAYRMEQALLRKFDRHQHPSNREVLVNVEYDELWNAWRDACNRNNPAAGAATMKRCQELLIWQQTQAKTLAPT